MVDFERCQGLFQSSPQFKHNRWNAELAFDMEKNKLNDGFDIPFKVVEEEVEKEDKNHCLTNRAEAYASPALRRWLIHLLKQYNEAVNENNFEKVLRDFLTKGKVIPPKMKHPMTREVVFHNFPSECKLWIFYNLRNYKKDPPVAMSKVATDSFGNEYFIVPGCRLYVYSSGPPNSSLPIDDSILNGQPWEMLYRFLYNQRSLLLCEDRNGWDVVYDMFFDFKLLDLCGSIRPLLQIEFLNKELAEKSSLKGKEGKEFEKFMLKFTPIPTAEEWEKMNTKIADSKERKEDVGRIPTGVEAVKANGSSCTNAVKMPNKKQKTYFNLKCWNFPQCPLHDSCKYAHPRVRCDKQPDCPDGWNCSYMHDDCPNDGHCSDTECAFEHEKSLPTYHRKVRDKTETATVTPVTVQASTMRRRRRCGYFPQCKRVHKDEYFHPVEKCTQLAAGETCSGQYCLYIHGACPQDGICEDENCIYEHYKSPVAIVIRMAKKKKLPTMSRPSSVSNLTQYNSASNLSRHNSMSNLSRHNSMSNLSRHNSMSNLNRLNSMSNLSLCSTRSRKSVSFADDVKPDKAVPPEGKKGILRQPANYEKGACRFRNHCTNDFCDYVHPKKNCPAFPKCPMGGACTYLHKDCKNDGVCRKVNCASEHRLQNKTNIVWCRKGSACKQKGCKFAHPEECTGTCSTPGDCWKYHKPEKPHTQAPPLSFPGHDQRLNSPPGYPYYAQYPPNPPVQYAYAWPHPNYRPSMGAGAYPHPNPRGPAHGDYYGSKPRGGK